MAKDHREMTEEEKVIWRKETLRRVEETTKSTKETLAKAAESRQNWEKALKDLKSIEYKWKDFQDLFDEKMKKLVDKIASGLGRGLNQRGENIAIEMFDPSLNSIDPEKAGELIRDVNNIIIVAGPGISVESGIPSYVGSDRTWVFQKKNPKDSDSLENKYFNTFCLKEKWNWCFNFIENIKRNKPNKGHRAIIDFQEYCNKRGKQCTVITECIDNYILESHQDLISTESSISSKDTKDPDAESNIFEANGNILYMRWLNECSFDLYLVPQRDPLIKFEKQLPICEKCGGAMRPHIKLIKDEYSEELHRSNSISELVYS